MTLTLVLVLVTAHFVGDFICQTDWMALNKSKRWDALFWHVMAYIPSLWIAGFFITDVSATWGPTLFLLVNFAAHFVQDAITSRINARLWQANQRHWFFVGIGADQLLHSVCLFITAEWWLR